MYVSIGHLLYITLWAPIDLHYHNMILEYIDYTLMKMISSFYFQMFHWDINIQLDIEYLQDNKTREDNYLDELYLHHTKIQMDTLYMSFDLLQIDMFQGDKEVDQ